MKSEAPLDMIDVLVGVQGTADGRGVHVIRVRDEVVETEARRVFEVGELRQLESERAIPSGSEIIRLSPRDDGGPAWNVEVVVPRQSTLSGPPQVATEQYRQNWLMTFDNDDAN